MNTRLRLIKIARSVGHQAGLLTYPASARPTEPVILCNMERIRIGCPSECLRKHGKFVCFATKMYFFFFFFFFFFQSHIRDILNGVEH